jgi:hypothetical protein
VGINRAVKNPGALSPPMHLCHRAMDVAGAYSVIYFVLLVIFGAYFVVRLW